MKVGRYKGRYNVSGVKIRQAREEEGISQEVLAQRLQLLGLEIGQNAVSRVELGLRLVPDYELKYFSKALKKSIEWLLEET